MTMQCIHCYFVSDVNLLRFDKLLWSASFFFVTSFLKEQKPVSCKKNVALIVSFCSCFKTFTQSIF